MLELYDRVYNDLMKEYGRVVEVTGNYCTVEREDSSKDWVWLPVKSIRFDMRQNQYWTKVASP